GVLNATTPLVVMLNSDMYASDGWLDELVLLKHTHAHTVPTSLLVESGRLQSAMPEYVMDLGKNPTTFGADAFIDHAEKIRQAGRTSAGRLYMPILVDRQEFFDVGGYPEGNPPGTTGDKDLIRRYKEAGYEHVTALGSVVYHCQLGEQEWP
ncbi:MAG: glycosyltransferase family 2 protein, partial [Planctomycetota bacterium]